MSVATPFFDLVYKQRRTLPTKLSRIDTRLVNQLNRLATRNSYELTDKNRERIARIQAKIENNYIQRDIITGQLIKANEVVLPKDEIKARLDVDNGYGVLYFDITDSPYDDTYTANEPLVARLSITGDNDNGGTTTKNSTFSIANGDYWQAGRGGTQTIFSGSPQMGSLLETLQGGTTAYLARQSQPLDVIHTQSFDFPYI